MSPREALKTAIRAVMAENPTLANCVVASDALAEDDALPGCVMTFEGGTPSHTFGPAEAWREFKVSMVWEAEDAGGVAGIALADPLNELTRSVLFEDDQTESAQARINRHLQPLGYSAMCPLETGDVGPYYRNAGKDRSIQRVCVGYFFDFRIQRI